MVPNVVPTVNKTSNHNVEQTSLSQILSMTNGDGEDSYTQNCLWQNCATDKSFPILAQALQRFLMPSKGPIVISDLGCSSGPRTLVNVSFITKTLTKRAKDSSQALPEFQSFFNDLPSTDFNFLFKLMTSGSFQFHSAGVPGSIYERLFSSSFINVFFSSHTLHFLSKIPSALTTGGSPAYNPNQIWLDGNDPAVINECKQQAKEDLKRFLDARAEELAPGGLLFCIFYARPDNVNWPKRSLAEDALSTPLSMWRIMEHVWEEMISEGILTRKQRAAFNLPWYTRQQKEVKEVVELYNDKFTLEVLEMIEVGPPDFPESLAHLAVDAHARTKAAFAIFGPLYKAHLGEEKTSIFSTRFEKLIAERLRHGGVVTTAHSHVLAMTRK
jgi:SAM-dependent methyltransferase